MPTNRRYRGRQRRSQARDRNKWADLVCSHLECAGNGNVLDPFNGDLEAIREYWEEHGEAITADEAAENPGRRPDAWWRWTHEQSPPIEDEADYLDRLGLLTDSEREALLGLAPAPRRPPSRN